MSVVCLDTQILYWAIVKKAVPGTEKLIPRAIAFIKWLDQQKVDVIVPTIVIAEMLIPVPENDRPAVLNQFRANWLIVEFDLKAAMFFAKMRSDHIVTKQFQDIRRIHPDVTKKELVADAMIIATAAAHGADKIYSHNEDFRKLAEGFIVTEDFLNVSVQLSLPESDTDTLDT